MLHRSLRLSRPRVRNGRCTAHALYPPPSPTPPRAPTPATLESLFSSIKSFWGDNNKGHNRHAASYAMLSQAQRLAGVDLVALYSVVERNKALNAAARRPASSAPIGSTIDDYFRVNAVHAESTAARVKGTNPPPPIVVSSSSDEEDGDAGVPDDVVHPLDKPEGPRPNPMRPPIYEREVSSRPSREVGRPSRFHDAAPETYGPGADELEQNAARDAVLKYNVDAAKGCVDLAQQMLRTESSAREVASAEPNSDDSDADFVTAPLAKANKRLKAAQSLKAAQKDEAEIVAQLHATAVAACLAAGYTPTAAAAFGVGAVKHLRQASSLLLAEVKAIKKQGRLADKLSAVQASLNDEKSPDYKDALERLAPLEPVVLPQRLKRGEGGGVGGGVEGGGEGPRS